ncbi:MAG: T9SS type A sorting domain-containing protein [Bacteroidota bacterium]
MKKVSFLLVFIVIYGLLNAQTRLDHWPFSIQQSLDFVPGGPVLGSSAIGAGPTSSICSPDGDLLMYTNNNILWDGNHNLINANLGNPIPYGTIFNRTQTLIIKQPCNEDRYFVFSPPSHHTMPGAPTIPTHPYLQSSEFTYSEVAASQPQGQLSVSALYTDAPLSTPVSTEKVTAIAHGNGRDIWVLAYDFSAEEYHAYLVDANGVSQTPVISDLNATGGVPISGMWQNSIGEMKVSPTKHKLAMAAYFAGIQLCDFDPQTGQVTNCELCHPDNSLPSPQYSNLEFSPSEDILYYSVHYDLDVFNQTSSMALGRLDLTQPTIGAICASFQYIFNDNGNISYRISGIQRGPDDRIYTLSIENTFGSLNNGIGVIANPDNLTAPNYTHIQYPTAFIALGAGNALPNFMQSYFDPNYEEQLDPAGLPNIHFTLDEPECRPCEASVEIDVNLTCGYDQYQIVLHNLSNNTSVGIQYGWQAYFSDLCAGNYEIEVRDPSNGQVLSSIPFNIAPTAQPPAMNLSVIDIACACDGTINLSGSGGAPPYQYFIDGIPFGGTASNLCPGIYEVEIHDSKGCIVGASVPMNEEGLQVDAVEFPFCDENDCSWGAAFFPQNGTPPYQYEVGGIPQTPGQSIFGPLCIGTQVDIEDANGCHISLTLGNLDQGSLIRGTEVLCGSTAGQGSFPTEDYEILLPPGYSINFHLTTGANSSSINGNIISVDWAATSGIHRLEVSIYDPNGEEFCYAVLDVDINHYCRVSGSPSPALPRLQLFPNPVEKAVNIQLNENQAGLLRGQILNLAGQSLLKWSEELPDTSYTHKIDVSDFPDGLYVLRLQIGEQVLTAKFLKR